MSGDVLWRTDEARVADADVTRFRERIASAHGVELADSHMPHAWSVANREALADSEALELLRDLPELADG